MALILRGLGKLYYYLNDDISDKRTQDWPLMRSPWPGIVIIGLYLMTVLKWLPKYMENRPAYDLRKFIAAYNAFQVLGCTYVVYQRTDLIKLCTLPSKTLITYSDGIEVKCAFITNKENVLIFDSLKLGWLNHYKLLCQPLDEGPLAEEYAWKVCYGYFALKLTDLFDTVFFVLRKKQNQVSFLHVYHHFGMVAVAWGMVKWVPGGHATLLVPVNSFVHIIMYSYYLITTIDESYKKALWWKKHVTQIQILQFSILLIHFLIEAFAPDCDYPRQPAYILIPQNLFMVILFCDFYYRSYIKKDKTKSS